MSEPNKNDNEVSLSVALTEKGIKAAAKSRAISSIDRLIGSGINWVSTQIESSADKKKAVSDTEIEILKALGVQAASSVGDNSPFVRRAIENHVRQVVQKQLNKDSVAKAAIEDLRSNPPTPEQASNGPNELSSEFLTRYERYAEDATSDHLRERWGRILASEIRKPGTFSVKALRTIDEIDSKTARLFESLCKHRIHKEVPKCLAQELNFEDKAALVTIGLLLDGGGFDHVRLSMPGKDKSGNDQNFFRFGDLGVSFSGDYNKVFGENAVIERHNEGFSIAIYMLTDVGFNISSIIEIRAEENIRKLADRIRQDAKSGNVTVYQRGDSETSFVPIYSC